MKNLNFLQNTRVVEGNQKDYMILSKYHYEPTLFFPPTKVFKVSPKPSFSQTLPDPLSVIVFSQPFPSLKSRNIATEGFFQTESDNAENLKKVNQWILYLPRLITDPRFLRQGLASYLLSQVLETLTIPIVETLTPTDFTNNMYIKAGFKLLHQFPPLRFSRLVNSFKKIGIILEDITIRQVIDERLQRLSQSDRDYIEKEIALFLGGYRNADRFKPGPERTKFILSKVPPPTCYLIWFNPRNEKNKMIFEHIAQKTD